MPEKSVHLGITSPPYNKKKQGGGIAKVVKYDGFDDNMPEVEYQKNQVKVLNEMYRVIKGGGSFFYNHKVRNVDGEIIHPLEWIKKSKWVVRQEIVWDRASAVNIRGWRFWQVDERIYWLYKPRGKRKTGKELESRHAKMTSVWRAPPEKKNPHPAPFPVWLPARIIYSLLGSANLGKQKVVLDPYMGSGTTGVAAEALGHSFIGIELSEKYVDQAEKRLNNILKNKERDKVRAEEYLHLIKNPFSNLKP